MFLHVEVESLLETMRKFPRYLKLILGVSTLVFAVASCGGDKVKALPKGTDQASLSLQSAASATSKAASFVLTVTSGSDETQTITYLAPSDIDFVDELNGRRFETMLINGEVFSSDPTDPSKFVVAQGGDSQSIVDQALRIPRSLEQSRVSAQKDVTFEFIAPIGVNQRVSGRATVTNGLLAQIDTEVKGSEISYKFTSYNDAPALVKPTVSALSSNTSVPGSPEYTVPPATNLSQPCNSDGSVPSGAELCFGK